MTDGERDFGLVIRSVVSKSNGGPYDDAAFNAGVYAGEVKARMEYGDHLIEMMVPTPLVPELDLYGMHWGYSLTATPWDEHPDEWTEVRLVRL